MAIYRYGQMQYELSRIDGALTKAGVPFIPLKGAVIRHLYPEPWMRTSCDLDILVKEEDLPLAQDAIQGGLRYRHREKGKHDVSYYSESGVHLELHYRLHGGNDPWDAILAQVWEYSERKTDFRYALQKEMLYFYHIAHMAGHFKFGGCGIRPFLDVCFLRKFLDCHTALCSELLEQGGLAAFDRGVCALSDFWFSDGAASAVALDLQEVVLGAGMYGDVKNRVAIAGIQKRTRMRALLLRIFLPYDKLKYEYPILEKHKILTPLCQLRRWLRLLNRQKRRKAVKELSMTVRKEKETAERMERLLKELAI